MLYIERETAYRLYYLSQSVERVYNTYQCITVHRYANWYINRHISKNTHISVHISMDISVNTFMDICIHQGIHTLSRHCMYPLIFQWMVNEYMDGCVHRCVVISEDIFVDLWMDVLIDIAVDISFWYQCTHPLKDQWTPCICVYIYNLKTTSLIWITFHRYTSIDTLIDASFNVFLKENFISVHIFMGYLSGRIQEYMHTSVHTSIE